MNIKIDKQDLGLRIKKFRKLKKMTQQQLADAIYKTESSVRKYEKGLVDIPTSVLSQIAEALDIKIWDLIGLNFEDAIEISENYAKNPDDSNDITLAELLCFNVRDELAKNNILSGNLIVTDEIIEQEKIIYEKKISAILNNLKHLNISGHQKALEYIIDLSKNPDYKK